MTSQNQSLHIKNGDGPDPAQPRSILRPGGQVSFRHHNLFILADTSGSMMRAKIEALNTAAKEAYPHILKAAQENPRSRLSVQVLSFGGTAQWLVPKPTPIADFVWNDLNANGGTPMGEAFHLLAEQMKMPPMPTHAFPPVVFLMSDGRPTDDWKRGLKDCEEQNWFIKAVRIAMGIGKDADYGVLKRFMNNPEIEPLRADTPEQLIKYFIWATTVPVAVASAPPSAPENAGKQKVHVPIPQPPVVKINDPNDKF